MLNQRRLIIAAQKHPFHILSFSTFPFFTAIFLFLWLAPQAFYLHGAPFGFFPRSDFIHWGILGLFATVMSWFITIVKESRWGYHTRKVQHGLRMGVILFIVSEVMFFFAFFWAFFHYSIVPSVAVGNCWLPEGSQELDPFRLPLLNTVLLLASGVTITVAHAALVKGRINKFTWYLFFTIILGITFLVCQYFEYSVGVKFSWRDNLYGSIFFVTTGFHGLHVTIGMLFLLFCWARQTLSEMYNVGPFWGFTPRHHVGFEAAAWYWHFVDVVWLFLFVAVYWWGGNTEEIIDASDKDDSQNISGLSSDHNTTPASKILKEEEHPLIKILKFYSLWPASSESHTPDVAPAIVEAPAEVKQEAPVVEERRTFRDDNDDSWGSNSPSSYDDEPAAAAAEAPSSAPEEAPVMESSSEPASKPAAEETKLESAPEEDDDWVIVNEEDTKD